MIAPHTRAFAARHFANTLNEEQQRLFTALFGNVPQAADVNEMIAFNTPATASTPNVYSGILIGALGYALGRSSASVYIVAEDIRKNWDTFSEEDKALIKQKCHAALLEDKAGMDMDRRIWEAILELEGGASEEATAAVRP